MEEWLGQLMAGWPVWAIFGGIIVIVLGYIVASILYSGAEVPPFRKKKHGKK